MPGMTWTPGAQLHECSAMCDALGSFCAGFVLHERGNFQQCWFKRGPASLAPWREPRSQLCAKREMEHLAPLPSKPPKGTLSQMPNQEVPHDSQQAPSDNYPPVHTGL